MLIELYGSSNICAVSPINKFTFWQFKKVKLFLTKRGTLVGRAVWDLV